ncbi:HTH-type transcriptional regulator DmlR [compost metagenome]
MTVNINELDLNHVRAFVRLVQLGSVTKAAAYLKQPKSRLSRHLSSLEQTLGVQLIHRTTRQFQLTEMGRTYYERCRSLVEGIESVTVEMSETNSEVSGWLKITAADDMGVLRLPDVIEEFSKQYPRVNFEFLLSQSYVDLVKESVDVALRVGHLKDSSLRARKVGSVKNIFVASPGFIERHRPPDHVEVVTQLPFVALSPGRKVDIVRPLDKQKLQLKTEPVCISNNPVMVMQMALIGKGIGFIPEFLCTHHIKAGRLVHLFKNWQSEEVPINLVTLDQKEVPLRLKKFMEFASKRLKDVFAGL